MELKAIDMKGKLGNALPLSDDVFGVEYNPSLVHQAVTAYLAGARQGSKAQKNRSAVSGGGAKPWRQKGTGRARAGTSRGPLWRTGGRAFAAAPRDFSQKMNKKAYRKSMKCILSELVRQERITVMSGLTVSEPKTKTILSMVNDCGFAGTNILIVAKDFDRNLWLSARNLLNVDLIEISELNPYDLVRNEHIIFDQEAFNLIEGRF